MKNMKVKEMTTIGILCALAAIVNMLAVFPLVPAVPWLTYDPKDVVIVIGGFIYGPGASFIMSFICSILEIMIKGGGPIDVIMNMISTCAFACSAAYIYKKKHNKQGAVIGLVVGIVMATLCMVVWNYIMTPIYYKMPREAVVALMVPGIIPFNLLKSGLNAGITLLLYKSVVTVLRHTHMIESSKGAQKRTSGLIVIGLFIVATIVCIVFIMQGII